MKLKFVILLFSALISPAYSAKVLFPGTSPGSPQYSMDSPTGTFTLNNNVIAVSWTLKDGQLLLKSITDKITGKTFPQTDSYAFSISISPEKNFIRDWRLIKGPDEISLKTNMKSPSRGRHFSGKAVRLTFISNSAGIIAVWTAELRKASGYIRTAIEITPSNNTKKNISCIQLFTALKLVEPKSSGKVKGSPVVDNKARIFCGLEVPFFTTEVKGSSFSSGFKCNLTLKSKQKYTFSNVIGVFPEKQLRRSILHYIERERARSYNPFLNYNCWFDLERRVSEKGMLDRINKIYNELGKKRGVYLDAYIIDDGYDDWNSGFWVFDKKKFPNGFKVLSDKVKQIHSHLGVWFSPAAGYGSQRKARIKRAAEIGIKSLDLSTPRYYNFFLNKMIDFVTKYNTIFFKWDRLGKGASDHFMALMDIAAKLRKMNPEIFLNTTVGTWPSPFWLTRVDCIWRGASDMGYIGVGDEHEKWMTYRDAISYNTIKKSGFIYPLNSLANHGLVFANGHPFPRRALKGNHNLKTDARIYFGGGYGLQTLYITPDIINDKQWNAIAEAAKWAKKNEDILVDTHFIGGNPNKLEVYGFAAWQHNKGTLALRNPKNKSQNFVFDPSEVFELPEGARPITTLKSPFEDQRIKILKTEPGKKITIKLKPFEVLIFDAE